MSDLNADRAEQRIDAALGRLPHWEPPADFAPRLAAAAARQSLQPTASPVLLQAGDLLQSLSDSVLLVLAALAVAGLLAWAVPWAVLVQSSNLIAWASAIAVCGMGLWMTRRALTSR